MDRLWLRAALGDRYKGRDSGPRASLVEALVFFGGRKRTESTETRRSFD